MNYGSIFKRFLALIIDAIILALASFLLLRIPYLGGFLSFIFAVVYFTVFETSSLRATPGKYWLGLSVTTETGDTLSFTQSLIRHFTKYISSAFLCFGYVLAFFTDKKQTLHDLIAKTVVVNAIQADMNIIDAFTTQFKILTNSFTKSN